MAMMQKQMDVFMEELASKAAVPGGGGASALGGAMGASLGSMVVNLTLGKKKYASVQEELEGLMGRILELKKELEQLVEEDAVVFEPLSKAYGLPSQTEEEKAYKDKVMEENLLAASLVPLRMMEKAVEMIENHKILGQKGSRLAISDVGVGVQFCRCALLGAVMNVYINTKSMKNRDVAEELNAKADALILKGTKEADEIYASVLAGLR